MPRPPSSEVLCHHLVGASVAGVGGPGRWARHNVRLHRTTVRPLHIAVVGDLELSGDALEVPGHDLVLIVYTAPAGSPTRGSRLPPRWAGGRTERTSGSPVAAERPEG